jgi:hypothetical protein
MDPLTAPIEGADSNEVAGVQVDCVGVGPGGARVKRAIYPPGFRWSIDMKPHVTTDFCMHAHVGFLAQGAIAGEYEDGCTFSFTAPAVFVLEPGHDAWVEGEESAVLIQFDAAQGTTEFFGLPAEHGH